MEGKCEFCNDFSKRLELHHLIFWEREGMTILLCHKCHTRLENKFKRFILYGTFKPDTIWQKEWEKRNKRRKNLFFRTIYKKVYIYQNIEMYISDKNNTCYLHTFAKFGQLKTKALEAVRI